MVENATFDGATTVITVRRASNAMQQALRPSALVPHVFRRAIFTLTQCLVQP
jgi:hypothetical protein